MKRLCFNGPGCPCKDESDCRRLLREDRERRTRVDVLIAENTKLRRLRDAVGRLIGCEQSREQELWRDVRIAYQEARE